MITTLKTKHKKGGFTTEWLKKSKVADINRHITSHQHKKEVTPGGRKVAKHFKKRSPALDWLGWNLLYWCNDQAVTLEEEYLFHVTRRWRFDWAIPSLMIAVEFEGGVFEKIGGHTTAKGYTKDTDKYREAAKDGWILLRYTTLNYKNLIKDLNDINGKRNLVTI